MQPEMVGLNGHTRHVGVEQGHTLTGRVAHAWVDDPVRTVSPNLSGKVLGYGITAGVEQVRVSPFADVHQHRIQRADKTAKVLDPAARLGRCRPKLGAMMGHLNQGGLKPIGCVVGTELTVVKPSGPIRAGMDKRCHPITRTRPTNPTRLRDEIELTDGLLQPRVGQRLPGREKRPICGVRDIFKQVDRREPRRN